MEKHSFDVVVIGGGPGGYVSAIRFAQLGFTVAVVEKTSYMGGCCLNQGCIPTKTLLESSKLYSQIQGKAAGHGISVGNVSLDFAAMMKRKDDVIAANRKGIDFLLKKNEITVYEGTGHFINANNLLVKAGVERSLSFKKAVIATGSKPWAPSNMPLDGKRVISSDEILSLEALPESIVIIGAGVIGLEMGSILKRLGVAVEVIELQENILPEMDASLQKELLRALKKQKLKIHLKHQVEGVKALEDSVEVMALDSKGNQKIFQAELCLVAVGRAPYTEDLGLENTKITVDAKGKIPVNAALQTAESHIYAIGDVTYGPMLAHKASEEGAFVAEHAKGLKEQPQHIPIPSAVYTSPEVASVGPTAEELLKKGVDFKEGSFPYRALGRAKASGELDGFAKVYFDSNTEEILALHLVGERASDLIQIGVVALYKECKIAELGDLVHPHPTFAEAIKEACLDGQNRAIHL